MMVVVVVVVLALVAAGAAARTRGGAARTRPRPEDERSRGYIQRPGHSRSPRDERLPPGQRDTTPSSSPLSSSSCPSQPTIIP